MAQIKFKENKKCYIYKMVFHVVKNLDDYYRNIMDKKWANKLIICYFTASWCGPCRMISPDITELGEKAEHNILVLKVDVDECEDVAAQCEIDCMPTFRFHIGNTLEPSEKLMGADKSKLFNIVGQIIKFLKERSENNDKPPQSQEQSHEQPTNNSNVMKNTEMEVPFLYNPVPDHQIKNKK